MERLEDDEDYDYEESTVLVELQGIMETEFLAHVGVAKILGVGTEKPLLQLDDYTFTGEYEDTMGTCLLFEDKTPESDDPLTTGKKLEYSCLTNKKLAVQRVFLKENTTSAHMDIGAGTYSSDETMVDAQNVNESSKPMQSSSRSKTEETISTEASKRLKPGTEGKKESETISEAMNKETISEILNKETLSEKLNKETISETMNRETISETVNKAMISETVNKETIAETVNKETINQ